MTFSPRMCVWVTPRPRSWRTQRLTTRLRAVRRETRAAPARAVPGPSVSTPGSNTPVSARQVMVKLDVSQSVMVK